MTNGSGISVWLMLLLILVAWPVFFALLWSAIVLSMSWIGGWHRLAQQYAVAEMPLGGRSWISGMVGWARYNRILTVATDNDGLYLAVRRIFRIGHPALFIPWSDIRNPHRSSFLAWEYIGFEVGSPAIARIRLQSLALDGTPLAATTRQKV